MASTTRTEPDVTPPDALSLPDAPPRLLPDLPQATLPPVRRAIAHAHTLITDHAETADARRLLLVVTGPAGAGASTVALHAAHRCAHPAGQLYADLGHGDSIANPPVPPGVVLTAWIAALGVPERDQPRGMGDLLQLWHRLSSRGVTAVVDGAVTTGQVQALIPAGPSALIVTSRQPMHGLACSAAEYVRLTRREVPQ